jgi:putative lipoprotein (rSAM/lipoprotein system)
MKKIKMGLIKRYNSLIGFLLAALGFGSISLTGCDSPVDPDPVAEHGVPYAIFKVKGKVTSEAEGIPNIKVKMGSDSFFFDSTYTDANGEYEISQGTFPSDQAFDMSFEDIDGAQNGSFQALDTIVEFVDPQFTGGSGNWDSGETETIFNVELKE